MADEKADQAKTAGEADALARKPGPAEGELPKTAKGLADKAKDLEALRTAVVDAAAVGGTLWVSYLFVLFYLFIAAAAVTHRDLFFESGVKPPFLDVALPLKGFFWLGPLIFIILHAYVLLHFVLLAGKVGDFNSELWDQIKDEDTSNRIRRQLPSNIFVQFLGAPRDVRHGLVGWMLRLVAWISLIMGPIVLLVFFQLQFLPYHDEAITWWQRFAVLIDLLLLWTLWPPIGRGERLSETWGGGGWRRWNPAVTTFWGVASALPILLVFTLALFPGERLHATFSSNELFSNLRTFLFEGKFDPTTRKPSSWFSNILVLPGLDGFDRSKFDTDAKFDAVRQTVSLYGRDLRGAVLVDANLRKADLTAVNLQDARLDRADLREARIACTVQVNNEGRVCARLQGAILSRARLQGAQLGQANLQGAILNSTNLQGAWLAGANMHGVELRSANLQGASLDVANLTGADLVGANLHAASMVRTGFRGASLIGAQLEGASLLCARLHGADLRSAGLLGVVLEKAYVWRANIDHANLRDSNIRNVETSPRQPCPGNGEAERCDMSDDMVNRFVQQFRDNLAGDRGGDEKAARLREILDLKAKPSDVSIAQRWDDLRRPWSNSAASADLSNSFHLEYIEQQRLAGCDPVGAPYVIQAWIERATREGEEIDYKETATLARIFLDAQNCPSTSRLPDSLTRQLIQIRDRMPPPILFIPPVKRC